MLYVLNSRYTPKSNVLCLRNNIVPTYSASRQGSMTEFFFLLDSAWQPIKEKENPA